jgi:hypothetical protein
MHLLAGHCHCKGSDTARIGVMLECFGAFVVCCVQKHARQGQVCWCGAMQAADTTGSSIMAAELLGPVDHASTSCQNYDFHL